MQTLYLFYTCTHRLVLTLILKKKKEKMHNVSRCFGCTFILSVVPSLYNKILAFEIHFPVWLQT